MFAGTTYSNPALYSAVYNGSYMVVNLALAVVICFLLEKPLAKIPK